MLTVLRRWLGPVLAVTGAALSLAVYSRLPERVVTHWGIDGESNGWMPKAIAVFILPVMMLVVAGVARLASRSARQRESPASARDAGLFAVDVGVLILFVAHLVIISVALGYDVPVNYVGGLMLVAVFAPAVYFHFSKKSKT